jgi:hypothetical protein
MTHAKNEQHLDGPSSHAAHHSQPLDDLLHRHLTQHGQGGNGAIGRMPGEVVDRPGLRFGEPGGAELPMRHGAHRLRGGEAVPREQVQDSAENGGRRFAGQLLVDDGAGQRGEGPAGAGRPGQGKRADGLDMPAEDRVAAAQLGEDVREVDGLDTVLGPETRNRHGDKA